MPSTQLRPTVIAEYIAKELGKGNPHIVISHELQFMLTWNGLFKKGNHKDNRTHLYDKIYDNSVRAVLPGKSRKISKKRIYACY